MRAFLNIVIFCLIALSGQSQHAFSEKNIVPNGMSLKKSDEKRKKILIAYQKKQELYEGLLNKSKSYIDTIESKLKLWQKENLEIKELLSNGFAGTTNQEKDLFSVDIGYRFSFLNQSNKGDVFYRVMGFLPKVAEVRILKNNTYLGQIGLFAGIEQSRISTDSAEVNPNSKLILNEEKVIKFIIPANQFEIQNYNYYRAQKVSLKESLALYFEPTFRLCKNLYFVVNSEVNYNRKVISFEDQMLQLDTLIVSTEELDTRTSDQEEFPFGTKKYNVKTFSSFVGGGLLFRYYNDEVEIHFKPMIGRSVSRVYYTDFNGNTNQAINDLDIYKVKFEMLVKKLNVSLIGEMNGTSLMKLFNYSIVISKKWDLNKITDFISK